MLLKTRTVWNINENLYFCESTFSMNLDFCCMATTSTIAEVTAPK